MRMICELYTPDFWFWTYIDYVLAGHDYCCDFIDHIVWC